jgi:hypothetical protein
MNLFRAFAAAALLGAITLPAAARSLCNEENIQKYLAWCVDPAQTLSEYQKTGLGEIVTGRFCDQGELVREGMFKCQGHNADAIKNILTCSNEDVLKAATAKLADNDARKPASCTTK